MKTICAVILTVALPTFSNLAQQSQRTWPWSSEYTSSERGPHHTRWIKLSVATNELGVASVQTNSFTQLGAGLNRWSGTAWVDATPELILTNGGVLGRGAQQTAFFAPDFATSRAPVRVWMPNGQLLAFKLLGLAYHDPATGTNILLAAPKSSSPQVVGTNSVWYSDCLDDVRCSIGYYYTADGVRQHVTLKECPAPPSAYGLPDASARLLVISEIIEGPSPQITERSWPAGREIERDQTLNFSDSMQMVPGRAFSTQDAGPGRGIFVGKTLETVGNRRFVVETVRYARVRNELLRLPPVGTLLTNASGGIITNASLPKRTRWYAQGTVPPSGIETAQVGRAVPSAPPQQTTASQPSQLASSCATPAQEPGFVLDYELVNTTWYGFTFDTSTTWLIYNETHISPSATILPGAVLKYYFGASLHIDGPLDCPDPGSGGQKAILTSCNDDTAGEIFWSNGSPQPGEYGPALVVSCSDLTAAQQRIEARYANPGVIANDGCLSPVSVTASDPFATKGAADPGKFTITREDGDWSQALTVRFALTGTAVAGVDYQAVPNSATIVPWAASVDIVITPGTPGSVAGSSSVVLTLQADSTYVLSPPSSAALTISDPGATTPPPVSAPAGLLDWWRGENDFADIAGGHTGTPANGLGFGSGAVGQAFNFDGTDDRLTASPPEAFNIGPGADFSVETWIKPLQGYATYGVQTILDKRVAPVGDYQALGYALWLIDGKLGCELADSPMAPYQLHNYGPAGPDLRLDGLFHHVAMTVDRDSTTGGKLYVDGSVVLTFDPTLEPGDLSNSGQLRIGNHANTAISCFFKGTVDEVSLYNHSLSQSEVQSISKAGARGKTLQNPLQFSAGGYRKSCEDKFYIWVTNTSGLNLTGGRFDLYTTFVPEGGNLYAPLQPWGPADVLPNGNAHLFTFCSADHSIANFDCMVVYQGASGYTVSSPKFRIATTNDSALLMKNTTLVQKPCVECGNCEGNPQDLIPPEARTACDSAKGIVGCGPEHCGTWASLLPASSSAPGAASRLDNYFKVADPPTEVELPCSSHGFKNVYAIKQWHGAWGPKSPMWNPIAGMNWDGTCRAPSGPANSLDSTKYLTLDATSAATSYTYCLSSTPASVTQAATVTSTCTVDPLSGRRVGGGSHSGDEPLMASALEALQNANVTIASLPDLYAGWVGSQALSLSDNLITSSFSSAPSASASRQYEDGSESYWNAQVDLTGGTFTATTGWQSGTSPSYSTTTIQVSVSETGVHYSYVDDWEAYSGDLLVQKFSGSNYVEATFRTAYTSANVDADCDALLAKWNLLDDIEYPWRTDTDLTRGPLVTYNECGPTAPAIVPPDFEETNSVPWPSQAPRTILGEPLSVHGPNGELYSYEPYFNFYHINWRFEDSVRGLPQGFVKSYGAASPYPNATQWVDDDQARVFPAGPFWAFGSEFEEADHLMFRLKSPYITDTEGEWEQGGYGGFVKCKWAEKLDPATPPGKDVLFKDWKFDFRDFIESYSWNATAWSWNNSPDECTGLSEVPPVRFTPFIVDLGQPGAGYYIGPGAWWISEMHTTSLHYSFDCCRPAVFVQPNSPGPDCTNGVFIPMPAGVCDARYGSLWMGRVDQSTSDAHACDNYVANQNSGQPNSPTCDPQIELDLVWHPGPLGGGSYETFVAPLGFPFNGSAPGPQIEIVSRDRFLAGSLEIPSDVNAPELEFVNVSSRENLGRYSGLLGGGQTRIYNSVEEILSDADLATGGQPDSQQVWFIRDEANPRKLDFYTCFNNVGVVQVTLFNGSSSVAIRKHTLYPADDFAFWINYVDNWVKGVGFDFGGPPPPFPTFELAGFQVPPSSGPLSNLTRACLIPLFNVVSQVEGMEAVALGLFDGVKNGLKDDWDLVITVKSGAVLVGNWAWSQAETELLQWRDNPVKRALELKRAVERVVVDGVFTPLRNTSQDLSTWNGFKKRAWSTWHSIEGSPVKIWTVGANLVEHIGDGLVSWYDDFNGRMLEGGDRVAFQNTPWNRDALLADLAQSGRQRAYTFGYVFGYLSEQAGTALLTAGTLKVAQVMVKGGVILTGNLASKALLQIAARSHLLKKQLATAVFTIELRLAIERGLVQATKMPVSSTILDSAGVVVETHLSKPGFQRSLFNLKTLVEAAVESPNTRKLFDQSATEWVLFHRFALFMRLVGDSADQSMLNNFARLFEKRLVVQSTTGAVVDWAEDFLRSLKGNLSLFQNRAPLTPLGADEMTRLRELVRPGGSIWTQSAIDDTTRGVIAEVHLAWTDYKSWRWSPIGKGVDFSLDLAAAQLKTTRVGSFSSLTKAIDDLVRVGSEQGASIFSLDVRKIPGLDTTAAEASLRQYVHDFYPEIEADISILIREYELVPN